MRYATRACFAVALAGGCIRERPPPGADAGATEALRPSPGRELRGVEEKPDVPAVAVVVPPAPPPPSIEERLRRCDPAVTGSVVRLIPALVVTEAELTEAALLLKATLQAMASERGG